MTARHRPVIAAAALLLLAVVSAGVTAYGQHSAPCPPLTVQNCP